MAATKGRLLLLELSSWSFAWKHVGPLFLKMSEWAPGDIAIADGSRPGHPTHSGKSMQPAAVKLMLLLLLLVGAEAEVDYDPSLCRLIFNQVKHQPKNGWSCFGI